MAGSMDRNTVSKHYCKSCGDENHCGRLNKNEDDTVKCGICKCAVCYPVRKKPVKSCYESEKSKINMIC